MRASSHRFYRPTSKTSIPDINGMPGKSAEKSEKRKENYIMADKIIENNQVSITGKITTGFHSVTRFTAKAFTQWSFL